MRNRGPGRQRRNEVRRKARKGREGGKNRMRVTKMRKRRLRLKTNRGRGAREEGRKRRRNAHGALKKGESDKTKSRRKRRKTRLKVKQRERRGGKAGSKNTTGRVVKGGKAPEVSGRNKRKPRGRTIGEKRKNEGTIEESEALERGTPRKGRDRFKSPKTGEDRRRNFESVRKKRQSAVETDTKKGGGGIKRERSRAKRERRNKMSLTRVNREEGTGRFRHIEREKPLSRPGTHYVESILDGFRG